MKKNSRLAVGSFKLAPGLGPRVEFLAGFAVWRRPWNIEDCAHLSMGVTDRQTDGHVEAWLIGMACGHVLTSVVVVTGNRLSIKMNEHHSFRQRF